MQFLIVAKNIILYGISKFILFINNNIVLKINNQLLTYKIIFDVCKYIDIRFTDKLSIIFNYKNRINKILDNFHQTKIMPDRDIKILVCFRYFSNRYNMIDSIFNTSIGILEQRVYWNYMSIVNGKQLEQQNKSNN